MIGRIAVGLKLSSLYLDANSDSFGSSGKSSVMRCSNFPICDNSPYWDSYLWKKE